MQLGEEGFKSFFVVTVKMNRAFGVMTVRTELGSFFFFDHVDHEVLW